MLFAIAFEESVNEFDALRCTASSQVEDAAVDEALVDVVLVEEGERVGVVNAHEKAFQQEVEAYVLAKVALCGSELQELCCTVDGFLARLVQKLFHGIVAGNVNDVLRRYLVDEFDAVFYGVEYDFEHVVLRLQQVHGDAVLFFRECFDTGNDELLLVGKKLIKSAF